MVTLDTEHPRSNGFQARYLLPSHWPILLRWIGLPPEVMPPLKDHFPLSHAIRGLLWFPAMMIAMLAVMRSFYAFYDPLATFGLNVINGWPYRPDILHDRSVPGRWGVAIATISSIMVIPASIQATVFANKPCGPLYALSLFERIIGEILQAPFRHVKAQLGGQRRIVEAFDLPPAPGPAKSKYTEFADSWLCAPDPDTRWADQSRPELAIALRRLLVTRYHLRTTFGAMLLYTIISLYYGVLFACFGFVAYPVFMAMDRYGVVMAWIIGIIWVVISVGALIILGIRVLGHSNAYAKRAKKRAAKGLPPELAAFEAAEVAFRRRYTDWWERL